MVIAELSRARGARSRTPQVRKLSSDKIVRTYVMLADNLPRRIEIQILFDLH